LHDAVNDGLTSFEWRKGKFQNILTGGRGLTFIERAARGQVINLWPLNPTWTTIKQESGRKFYLYKEPGADPKRYEAAEVIDIAYMMKSDGVQHRGPIATNRDVIALAIAATQFGSKFFQNGGVPPFAVTGNFQSGQAMKRAAADLADSVKSAAKEKRQALVLPVGMDIKPLGVDAEKSQLVELKRLQVEEIARIYSLPPTFLQDLSHGTFSNTEQQDLHYVKHTLKRWVEAFEQELNLKLFGRKDQPFFVALNMDGLLRGDFKTRMEGYAQGIQNAVLTPDEARDMENRPKMAGGDRLLIQGATVPLVAQEKGTPNAGA
jgi:HK97 family phage portal protein